MLNDVLLMPINKIKKLIGTTTDTGGSSTSGTMMGKLNNIISNNSSTVIGNTTDTGATATTGTVMGKSNAILELTNKIEQRYCKIPVSEVKSITCPAKATSGMQNYGEIAFEYVKPISLKAIQIASGYSSCKYYVTIYNGEESYTVATDTGNSNIFLYPGVSGLSQSSSLPQYIVYGSIVATKIVIKGYNDATNTGTTSNITLHS